MPDSQSWWSNAKAGSVWRRCSSGVDPHKLSATIEVVVDKETVLAKGRSATDKVGYLGMRKTVSGWPDRVWAVEG
jgi:hypothetical protein